jgi:hypothetical protein
MELKQGSIAWGPMLLPNGKIKERPLVIATPTGQIPTSDTLRVVGISTSYRPNDPKIIPLAFRDDGNIYTRLRRPCAISLALVADIDKSSLRPSDGWVGKAALIEMLEKL